MLAADRLHGVARCPAWLVGGRLNDVVGQQLDAGELEFALACEPFA